MLVDAGRPAMEFSSKSVYLAEKMAVFAKWKVSKPRQDLPFFYFKPSKTGPKDRHDHYIGLQESGEDRGGNIYRAEAAMQIGGRE